MHIVIGILATALGLFLVILGVISQKRSNKKYKNIRETFVLTTGKVKGISPSRVGVGVERWKHIHPTIEFVTSSGEEITLRTNVYRGNLDIKPGDEVKVYYNPSNPNDAIYYVAASQFLPTILCGSFSLALFILAYAMFFVYPERYL